MENYKMVGEHSVDLDVLNKGVCIDVGCRGFAFSNGMKDLGLKVYAFDLELMEALEGVTYISMAVTDKTDTVKYVKTEDKQATYLHKDGTYEVMSVSLNEVYQITGDNVDVLKLDCEGSEYLILSDKDFKPIPKQISVEFHKHSQPKMHDQYYLKCMDNLTKYYNIVQHDFYEAHGAGWNFWNSLFLRKDL